MTILVPPSKAVRLPLTVLSSIGYSPEILALKPFIARFDTRGASEVAHAKRSGRTDTLVIVSREALPGVLRESAYVSRLLPPDCAGVSVRVVAPSSTAGAASGASLCAQVLADAALMDEISRRSAKIKFFASGADEVALMTAVGAQAISVTPTPEVAERYGSKIGSKLAFDAAGVATPPGPRKVFTDMNELRSAIVELAADHPASRRAVTKMNGATWAGGNGFERIDLEAVRAACGQERPEWFEVLARDLGPRVEQGVILEAWLEGVTESPSGQASISLDGRSKMRSSHRQILDSKQNYEGAIYPAAHHAQITDAMLKVARVLASEGVRGPFGIDFVVVCDGDHETVVANEINLRQTGTFHSFRLTRYVAGATRSEDDQLLHFEDGAVVHYVNRWLHEEGLRHLDLESAVAALEAAGLAYNPETQTGAMLQITAALPLDFVEITAVGRSTVQAANLQALSRECLIRAARERLV